MTAPVKVDRRKLPACANWCGRRVESKDEKVCRVCMGVRTVRAHKKIVRAKR